MRKTSRDYGLYIKLMMKNVGDNTLLEYGLCECGCGGKTTVSKRTEKTKGWVKGIPRRFVFGHGLRGRVGRFSSAWHGGRYIQDGYVVVYSRTHPRTSKSGYVREHILIAEKALGEQLPNGSEVHHTKNRGDNSGLVVCQDSSYHKLLHVRGRAFYASGDPNKRKCKYCKEYDSLENMYVSCNKNSGGISGYHRECRNKHLSNKKDGQRLQKLGNVSKEEICRNWNIYVKKGGKNGL